MAIWKQLLGLIAVVCVIGFVGVKFVPGGRAYLAHIGVTSDAPAAQGSGADTGQRKNIPPSNGSDRAGGRSALVVVAQTTQVTINNRLLALGTGAAVQSATLTPSASGLLTEVLVESGANVAAGQIIATLDPASALIAYDLAKIANDDAQKTLLRSQQLGSSLSVSGTQLQAYQLAADKADLALRQARIDLDNRSIVSPIAGTIGLIQVNPGIEVTQSTSIATVQDNSAIKVSFNVPERYVGKIRTGAAVSAVPIAQPGLTLEAKVTAIDNRVDETSGSFEVQALIPNLDHSLRSGMSFTMTIGFSGDSYLAVEPLAVQWGSEGSYVWRIVDHKAERVPVVIVQRNAENVLVSGGLALGDLIATEGLDSIKEGATVRLFGEDAPKAEANAEAPAANAAPSVVNAPLGAAVASPAQTKTRPAPTNN